jgi:hypothetical protein
MDKGSTRVAFLPRRVVVSEPQSDPTITPVDDRPGEVLVTMQVGGDAVVVGQAQELRDIVRTQRSLVSTVGPTEGVYGY